MKVLVNIFIYYNIIFKIWLVPTRRFFLELQLLKDGKQRISRKSPRMHQKFQRKPSGQLGFRLTFS